MPGGYLPPTRSLGARFPPSVQRLRTPQIAFLEGTRRCFRLPAPLPPRASFFRPPAPGGGVSAPRQSRGVPISSPRRLCLSRSGPACPNRRSPRHMRRCVCPGHRALRRGLTSVRDGPLSNRTYLRLLDPRSRRTDRERLSVAALPAALGAVSNRRHLSLAPRSLPSWIRQAHGNLRAGPGVESVSPTAALQGRSADLREGRKRS